MRTPYLGQHTNIAERMVEIMAARRNYRDQFGPKLVEALVYIIMDEFNILRNIHGLPDRTKQQLVDALKNELDSLPDYPE
jgi:hypothetical protein